MEETRKPPYLGERRRHKRFELSLALAYRWGMTKGTFRTVDLSLGGVKIQTIIPIPVDERLNLTILIRNEVVKPVGRVVRSDRSPNGKYDVGIGFETIAHECLRRLDRFLHGFALEGEKARLLHESSAKGFESKPLELYGLKANFLRWLHKSYPSDYSRYAHRPEIGENEIRDFLKNKGFDKLNVYYLIKALRGG
jgi:hypothetical protein